MKIELIHIFKTIKSRSVLQNINMAFAPGKIYGLQGVNGSGKTMLLRLISGLVRPSKGQILIDGRELGKEIEFPSKMGILIENPAFIGTYSAFENIKLLSAVSHRISDEEIKDAIALVGLDPDDRLPYKKFSLGMKQRLGICGATFEKPELLLLDEPTNTLDSDGVTLMHDIIHRNSHENEIMIIASHDAAFLSGVAHCLITMSNGRVVSVEDLK